VDKVIGLLEWRARFPLYAFRGPKEHYGTVPMSAWNYRGIHRLEEALRKLPGLKMEEPPFFALFSVDKDCSLEQIEAFGYDYRDEFPGSDEYFLWFSR